MHPEFDRYAAEGYSELARDPIRDRFSSGPRFFHARRLALLRERLRRCGMKTEAADWLDVGCGEGDLLALGKSRFSSVAGCDVSGGMIRSREGIDVRKMASARQVPFADESFDVVTAVCVYHHVSLADRPALTADIARVLRPGGVFCVMEHNPYNPVARLIVRFCPIDVEARLLRAPAVRRLAIDAGMEFLETRYFLYFPERLYSRAAALEDRLASIPLGGQYALFAQKAADESRPSGLTDAARN